MAGPAGSRRETLLRLFLEDLHARYHQPGFLATDPLGLVYQYRHPEDREVAALVAAAFASGNITSIRAVVSAIFTTLGERPVAWLRDRPPARLAGAFRGIRHRWVREGDLEIFLAILGEALRRHGSLGALWRTVDDPAEPTTAPALARFAAALHALPVDPLLPRRRTLRRANGVQSELAPVPTILLTSPARGSACKRMNLFLRWVVRPADGIDLGLWSPFVDPARLLMPVDTHVLRIARKLHLTRRKVPDRLTALELTARFSRLSPGDPCRYDFALVRAGILDRPREDLTTASLERVYTP